MKHFLSYLGDDAALYEAALLNLFQRYPPSASASVVSITIHRKGKAGGNYTATKAWPPGSKNPYEIAKFIAENIVTECKPLAGMTLDGVTIEM